MDLVRFDQLIDGDVPTLHDFANFVSVVEKLPLDILWLLSVNSPNLNHALRAVVDKQLVERVQRTNIDNALSGITARLMKLSNDSEC